MKTSIGIFCALAAFSALPLAAAGAEAPRVELDMAAGADWAHVKWFGPVRLVLSPQIAVWLEDPAGRFTCELFVTEKAGKSAWGKVRRPEALPVWSHARGKRYPDGLYMPTVDEPLPDAVCGATPKARKRGDAVGLTFALPEGLAPGPYRLMVEVNCSFDFNPAYPERKGDVNGQPSVVYAVPLDLSAASSVYAEAVFAGTGSPDGSDGAVRPGAAGLDGALRIVERVRARVVR